MENNENRDFFDISEEDLNMPEYLIFEPGEVQLLIQDYKQDNEKGYLMVVSKVLSGEHEGSIHQFFIRKKAKRSFVPFVKAFWTREEILGGKMEPTKLIGRTVNVIADAPREYKGKMFQDFSKYVDLGIVEAKKEEQKTNDIPF